MSRVTASRPQATVLITFYPQPQRSAPLSCFVFRQIFCRLFFTPTTIVSSELLERNPSNHHHRLVYCTITSITHMHITLTESIAQLKLLPRQEGSQTWSVGREEGQEEEGFFVGTERQWSKCRYMHTKSTDP
jgi:hypothetical protein